MAKTMGQTLLDKGYELQEQYNALLEQRAANRRSLRDLATQELLDGDEYAALDELYPPRQAKEEQAEGAAA